MSNDAPEKPTLSHNDTNLLLMAERGEDRLLNWYVSIYLSWDKLPILNEQYGGGYIKWQLGDHIALFDDRDGPLPDNKIIVYHNEETTELEWREYKYAHNSRSLFQCFFKIFPEIDNVETEKISGLKFKNPFMQLNLGQVEKEDFFNQARACNDSKEFHEDWIRLKTKKLSPQPQITGPEQEEGKTTGEEITPFMIAKGGGYCFPDYDYWTGNTKPAETFFLIINNPQCKDGIVPTTLYLRDEETVKNSAKGGLPDIGKVQGDDEENDGSEEIIALESRVQMTLESAEDEETFKDYKSTLIKRKTELQSKKYDGQLDEKEEKELKSLKSLDSMTWRGTRVKSFPTEETRLIKNIRQDISRFIDGLDTKSPKHKELKSYLEAYKPYIINGLIYYTGKT